MTHLHNTSPRHRRRLLAEVEAVHRWVLRNYPVTHGFEAKLAAYRKDQSRSLFPPGNGTNRRGVPPFPSLPPGIDGQADRFLSTRRRLLFVTTNDWSHDGGSEQLWIKAAIRAAALGHDVTVAIKRWDPEPYFLADFRRLGIAVHWKDGEPGSALKAIQPDLAVINIGDQDEGTDWYAACKGNTVPYVIINHLTKSPACWPVQTRTLEAVREGNLGAAAVLFTSRDNRRLMEERIGRPIPRACLFHNPLFLDRDRPLPLPDPTGTVRIALPARMLRIHKGQDIAIEVFAMPKWRKRPIELHLYGHGPDEESLRSLAANLDARNVHFHDPRWQLPNPDLESIWRECHALLMTSHMEGMPLTLLNAMFHGRVPIVTDIGGHREVIVDGVSGFIASEATTASVDAALERAWQRREDWRSIGMESRASMLRFAPADPVLDLLEKLLLISKSEAPVANVTLAPADRSLQGAGV